MGNIIRSKLDANQVIREAYDDDNKRLRVDAEITATIGTVEVSIDAAAGDNISIASQDGTNYLSVDANGAIDVNVNSITLSHTDDSIAIGDGTNLIDVNSDGSLNVIPIAEVSINLFNEILSVPSGSTMEINSYTVPAGKISRVSDISVSGDNIAKYILKIDGSRLDIKRTYFGGSLNELFTFNNQLQLVAGQEISVEVENFRPDVADFNCRISIVEKDVI